MLRTAEAMKTGRSKALERKNLEKKELFLQPLLHLGHLQEAHNHSARCSAKSGRGLAVKEGEKAAEFGERLERASSIKPAFP